MNLIDNKLVRKYFLGIGDGFMADRILTAMQTPIRKGERILIYYPEQQNWYVTESTCSMGDWFHPQFMRLPDAFQPAPEGILPTKKCEHGVMGEYHWGDCKPGKKECEHSWIAHCATCGKEQELKLSCPICGSDPTILAPEKSQT